MQNDDLDHKGNLTRAIENFHNLSPGDRAKVEIILWAEQTYQQMIGDNQDEPHSSSIGRQG